MDSDGSEIFKLIETMGLDITIKKLEIIGVVTNEIIPDCKESEVIKNKIVDDHNCSSSEAKEEIERMCNQCGKLIFYTNFSRHVKTHSDLIYNCLTCDKSFSRELDRDRHINSFHLKKEYNWINVTRFTDINPR